MEYWQSVTGSCGSLRGHSVGDPVVMLSVLGGAWFLIAMICMVVKLGGKHETVNNHDRVRADDTAPADVRTQFDMEG